MSNFQQSGIQHVSAQKQAPSAIDFLGSMKEAVSIERRLAKSGTSCALKDLVQRCVAEYNRMVTQRKHRIDTGIKNMIVNLFFGLFKLIICFSATLPEDQTLEFNQIME